MLVRLAVNLGMLRGRSSNSKGPCEPVMHVGSRKSARVMVIGCYEEESDDGFGLSGLHVLDKPLPKLHVTRTDGCQACDGLLESGELAIKATIHAEQG
jgi:hypothetical protein